jgi:chromosome partitioning protein
MPIKTKKSTTHRNNSEKLNNYSWVADPKQHPDFTYPRYKRKVKTKIISVNNHKGGVGKTTSALNIAIALASHYDTDVLLIDLDPQANLTQCLYTPEMAETGHSNIYEVLKGRADFIPIAQVRYGVDLMPSTIDLSGAELELSGEPGREYLLAEVLKKQRGLYDYIIIDTPPSIGLLTINSLTASDYVLIPVQSHYLAVQGLTKLLEAIEKVKTRLNKKLNVGGLFLTLHNKRTTLANAVADYVKKEQPHYVFKTAIRSSTSLASAPAKQETIFEHDPKGTGANDYYRLTKEIIKKLK